MSYSSMDFGAMEQAYAAFQQKFNQMNSELDDLAKSVESKLGQWEDGAKDAYFDAKRQWESSAADISRIVQQLGSVIQSSGETGQSTVHNNVNVIGG
ncbi:WXG100 family type VII secretion target [Actinomadura darangshiensis]|uniref:WXG100 family type VII secretion target n=1 Tax=Actinomadura darangshiensis TaxID=705336 RepID=A0A4R5B760_9ACTN|nr:WXG100 family type VII secretion target [Actinomadura darangshiensis]TDD80500.1 WXG100 family type VII secretion target [Actinomadura darangshiensis]